MDIDSPEFHQRIAETSYPEWAPLAALAYMRLCLNDDDLETRHEKFVFHQLSSDPKMEIVWKSFRRWSLDEAHFNQLVVPLSSMVCYLLHHKSGWATLSKRDMIKHHDKIVGLLGSLADATRHHPVSRSLFDHFTAEELQKLTIEILHAANKKGVKGLTAEMIDAVSQSNITSDDLLLVSSPKFPVLLDRMRDSFQNIDIDNITPQNGGKHADVRLFVRMMATYTQMYFGKPLHNALAHLAMVFFPDVSLDEQKVRLMLPRAKS